jgi:hypothetical protein
MSLINDALKKAQKQRAGDNAPASGSTLHEGEASGSIAKRDKPPAFTTLLIRIGLITGALLIVLVGAYLGRHRAPQPIIQPTLAQPTSAPATPTPPPVVSTVKAPDTVSLPIPAAAPAIVAPEPTVTPPPPPPPSAPPKFSPQAIIFVENLRISVIRASATDSKVLMSDRVYRTGDIVAYELGLKLVEITADSLTFENESGARYTRNF